MEDQTLKNELSSELTGLNKGDKAKKKKNIIIGVTLGAILLILFIIIIILINTGLNLDNDPSNMDTVGEINCIYEVQSPAVYTVLLGNDFTKNTEFEIYVDNQRIKYSRDYKFDTIGNHNVQIRLYNEIDMDYMFKDVQDLISVEMKSDKNCKISSMIRAFENCTNLQSVKISGFNGENIKSMHKMFYNSGLTFISTEFNFTINVEDMSYMFASSQLKEILFSNLNTNKVTNMSHMFDSCNSLINVDSTDINTNEVIDMSYMFHSCLLILILVK